MLNDRVVCCEGMGEETSGHEARYFVTTAAKGTGSTTSIFNSIYTPETLGLGSLHSYPIHLLHQHYVIQ